MPPARSLLLAGLLLAAPLAGCLGSSGEDAPPADAEAGWEVGLIAAGYAR